MAWDEDYEYSNGADGSCQTCGAETSEPWHALCAGCYAADQGWARDQGGDDQAKGTPDLPRAAGYSLQYRLGYVAGYQAGWDASKRRNVA